MSARLPEGFETLEPWVDGWVLPDSAARARKRQTTDIDEIRGFYEAVLAEAPRALELLSTRRLGELDTPTETLLKLLPVPRARLAVATSTSTALSPV